MKKGVIKLIEFKQAKEFLLPKHYSGKMPCVSFAFGWFIDNSLVAVCTFGKPANPSICKYICGGITEYNYSKHVYELNRLCRIDELDEPLSYFVSRCLRELSKKNFIIVSYSDTDMNHHGYIYQACNFLYTGSTDIHHDRFVEGKHPRHYTDDVKNQKGLIRIRSEKHRYVYFAMKDKKLKHQAMMEFNYNIFPYPKGDNKNYQLGFILQPKLVDGS